jgi:plastocyanin domain-containing protein
MTPRALVLLALLGASHLACNAAPPPPPARVAVAVSHDGCTPATVDAEAGRPLTLVFTRADAENCGEKVVFPERGIERPLPVGQPVEVTLTPKAGEHIAFTCGMGMYKGAVVAAAAP